MMQPQPPSDVELVAPVAQGGEGLVHPDDLIDDRSLASADQDAFRLEDVVEEVAALCASAPTPATIGLWGSWGSGKSSLGNLLEARLASDKKVSLARFDAFKYAEVPLRRHFLSQLADAYAVKKKEKFKRDLYASTKEVGVSIPKEKLWRLGLMILLSLAVTTVLALAAAAAIALVSTGGLDSFSRNFTRALRASVPGIAIATPLLAAAFALVGKYLTAETTVEAPSSEEQFEELFKKLVETVKAGRKCERLVVFIDELDRCSPRQVVSALETLRTFLEVKDCVFVVAADQQVLEYALNDAARQATPFNPANPYYSAGSAYLDKIFQYQLQLPPVLPRRLSRYALDLIAKRQGVWAKVANRAELVSVLVPTHVTSPRRVKVLLNAFALLYRLALRRASEGAIDTHVEERVAEIAKLACLRTEFPLFAADFQLDARLPEVVLMIWKRIDTGEPASDDEIKQEFAGLSDETLSRAYAYAEERLPVDEVIARQPRLSLRQRVARAQQQSAAAQAAQPTPGSPPASPPGADEEPESPDAQVEMSHARQLIRYLERTQRIKGPRRDLVYLESAGAAFGLPSELAEQIERDAIDGSKARVAEQVKQLGAEDQLRAFRLLARLVVESVGIETENVVGALFTALAVTDVALGPVADDLLNSLVTYSSGYRLESEDLLPALRLALSRKSAPALGMRRNVLGREELVENDYLAAFALEHLADLRAHRSRLAAALSAMLERRSGSEAERALEAAPEDEVVQMLDEVELEDAEAFAGLAAFVESARENGREQVAARGFRLLLASEEEAAAEAAQSVVHLFAPITDKELAPAIVKHALARPVVEWHDWLAAVDASAVQQTEEMSTTIDSGVKRLWTERFADRVSSEDFAAVAEELGRLHPVKAEEEGKARLDLLDGVPPVITPPPTAQRFERYKELKVLANAGAVAAEDAGASVLADLEHTLASPQSASYPGPLSQHVLASAEWPLSVAPADAIESFSSTLAACAWLEATMREILIVRCASALRRLFSDATAPETGSLATLVASPGDTTDVALAEWITAFVPEPTLVFETLAPRLTGRQRLPNVLRDGIAATAAQWSPEQKTELLRALADEYRDGNLDDSTLRAAGIGDAEPDAAGDVLVALYSSSKNNDQRAQVMALWSLVDPAPDRVRRKLINQIYLSLLKEGKRATRVALDYFSLVRHPPSQAMQQKLKSAIHDAAKGDRDLARKADRLARDAGWVKSKRRWLPW